MMGAGKTAAVILLILAAMGAGYWLGRSGIGSAPAQPAAASSPQASPTPPEAGENGGKGRLLYYRNPMGLPDTSPVPKKDEMGMDYIPVYADEAAEADAVTVSPGRMQILGVRTAPVEQRKPLAHKVRAAGTVEFDERRLAVVSAKAAGWIEKVEIASIGEHVQRGQILAWLYSPDLVAAEQDYVAAAGFAARPQDGAGQSGNGPGGNGQNAGGQNTGRTAGSGQAPASPLVQPAEEELRGFGLADDEIEQLKRTGRPSRLLPLRAPQDGIVVDKMVVEGMHAGPHRPLFRIADLSQAWIVAEVAESDFGLIRPGQKAIATFPAFPGRSYEGMVDVVYPSLNRKSRTGRLRIAVRNDDLSLRRAMFATIDIATSAEAATGTVTVVPDSAVIDGGKQQIVLVETAEGRFTPREVKVGTRSDGLAELLDGVRTGERVVVDGNFLIDSESNLRAALRGFARGSGTKSAQAQSTQGVQR
jgi:membrane fusion protein, copper/silver efflux system